MSPKFLKCLSKEEFRGFINSFDAVLSDCDGVLWVEKNAIEGSPETVEKFRDLGKKFFYITNNNGKTREELVKKCKSHGYEANSEEIICSSYLAAQYLKQKNFNKKVYIVGSDGIAKEFDKVGIEHCGVGPDVVAEDEVEMLESCDDDLETNIGAVVVGFDKHFSFSKLVKAATYLQDPKVHFIGTNPDIERPSPSRAKFPCSGSFILPIEALSGRKATILGKPETFVSQIIKTKYKIDPSRTLIIGDNLNTDIMLGKRCGFTSLLVMSGITKHEQIRAINKNSINDEKLILPDYCADRLSDILDCLAQNQRI